ncbi:Signal transduction histidine kinase, contains PAS domain [Halanaeroarchaeum sp. HSR-CO]|uniref:sensor histidine kinase n=1 Tax=Halanaeroarchaeum sp. HSR-CO TaxID=2866382 RepID=UPI00217EDDAB|nr:HAMP domain-containing sensor histidine kinase [Halanaeroarchaeum sp. HSR-CO]UWG48412.1 Signal transduction histidine kinase, contains PAS domain [Halanaeroarchaeum sp. HSR-CO]
MHTVQLLIEDSGNREVISEFLDDTYDILTGDDVEQADAYLVEDSLYSGVRDDLHQVVVSERPVFRPVVLIRGAKAQSSSIQRDVLEEDERSLVVDSIDAPVRGPVVRRRLASLLERREQSRELQQKIEQVERQRDALSVLNQMVRHDIRNDMQLVLGYAQQLADSVDQDGADALETVIDSTEEAIELTTEARELTDLLLEADSNIGSIRINDVVEDELAAARNAHPDSIIDYRRPETDLTVTGDKMFSSVIRNLVSNAIRHNDAETPRVSVSLTHNGGSAFLSVADNGPGIPDEQTPDIFERGSMGDESRGTGIGLYLVSMIVDRYGGDVHVTDSESGGAEFVVELPIAE